MRRCCYPFCGERPRFLSLIVCWLYSTLLPEPWAAVWNCAGAHHGRLTPPRFSPSCPHCVILRSRAVAGQEYHCVLTGSLRNSLPGLFLGWMGTAGHLIWPSLIAEVKFTAIRFLLQVVLAHPPYRFPFLTRTVRERIPVAGYDRRARCFSKSTRGCFALSSLYYNLRSLKPTLFFQKFQNKFFKGRFSLLNSPVGELVFFT